MITRSLKLNTFNISIGLLFLLGLLVFTYIILASYIVSVSYNVDGLYERISEAERETTLLHIELSQAGSLDYILTASNNLFYTGIENISYIKKANISPFASR